jgi:hypothetical protein
VGYDNLPFHRPNTFDRVTLRQWEGKRSKIGKLYSVRASNEGLKDTKKRKAMININMKRYEKFYVCGSHKKRKTPQSLDFLYKRKFRIFTRI